jgi:hypothetical protein
LSKANLAQFRAKIGIGKFFQLFLLETKIQLELRYGPVDIFIVSKFSTIVQGMGATKGYLRREITVTL